MSARHRTRLYGAERQATVNEPSWAACPTCGQRAVEQRAAETRNTAARAVALLKSIDAYDIRGDVATFLADPAVAALPDPE